VLNETTETTPYLELILHRSPLNVTWSVG